jgi:hypothetical protein
MMGGTAFRHPQGFSTTTSHMTNCLAYDTEKQIAWGIWSGLFFPKTPVNPVNLVKLADRLSSLQ